MNNQIADYEGFYASVVYSYFAGVGVRDRGGGVEQPRPAGHGGAHRRPRVPVRVQGRGDGAAGGCADAVASERGYADKYRGGGEPIHLIGVEFSRETRNVTAFEVADGLSAGSPSRGYFVVHETAPSIRPRAIGSHGIYGSRSQMS